MIPQIDLASAIREGRIAQAAEIAKADAHRRSRKSASVMDG